MKLKFLKKLRLLGRSAADFESSWDLGATQQETWCRIVTAVLLKVPSAQSISSIIFVFVKLAQFGKS